MELRSTSGKTTKTVCPELTSIQQGVPQGSVLEPVMFFLLTNDMPADIDRMCQAVMFSDDTVITLAERKREQLSPITKEAFSTTKEYCN